MKLINSVTKLDDDYESQEKTELEKCHDFIEYSHDKVNKYNTAMDKILTDIKFELKTVDLNSKRIIDIYKFKMLKKKCIESLFWVTKSHELLAVLSNYYKVAKYTEKDVEKYKNATQRLYITDKLNFKNEYPINSIMPQTNIMLMNLGYDETRNLKITAEISNTDLGINIQETINTVFNCKRMKTVNIELPEMDTPTQQCRANFVVKIQNDRDEVILKEIVKEIFFRKEGN